MSDDEIKLDLTWFDDLLSKTNGTTQYDLFKDNDNMSVTSQGAATITSAAGSGNLSWGPSLTNGTGGYIFQGPSTSVNSNIFPNINVSSTWDTNWKPNPGLHVKGDAEFEGDVKIKGKSITDMFEKIEEKLAILHPNEELEAKWEKLRELRQQYIELEKEIIEKEKMWEILKR